MKDSLEHKNIFVCHEHFERVDANLKRRQLIRGIFANIQQKTKAKNHSTSWRKGVVLSSTHLRTCDLGHLCLHLRSPVGDRHVKAVVAAHLESNFQFTLCTSMQTNHLQIFQHWIGNRPSRQPSPSNGRKQ